MREPGKQLELTREELKSLVEVKEKCAPLYADVVSIVTTTFLAIQKAVNAADVLRAVAKMLDDAEKQYNITATAHPSPEIAINRTRFFICCLATRLLPLASNFPTRSTERAAA